MRPFLRLRLVPGGPALMFGSVLVAPGMAAIDVVLLLALHRDTGSVAAGGGAVAVFTIANAGANLAQGRLLDRADSLRLLATCALAAITVAGGLSAALAARAGTGWLLGLIALLGALLPATGAALRGLWSARAPDGEVRTTAFAFLSLTQELGFLAGPGAFAALAVFASPAVALLGCTASIAGGTLVVVRWGAVEAPVVKASVAPTASMGEPASRETNGSGPDGSLRGLWRLAALMVLFGGTLGGLDVAAAAFAVQHGAPSLSGVMLGACSVGGLLGGLAYGARNWRAGSARRLAWAGLAAAAGLVLPALAPDLGAGVAGLVVAGAPVSVTLTTAYLCAEGRVPPARRTEAFAGLGLALNAGVALGNLAGGALSEGFSAHAAFLLSSGCALACALGARSWLNGALSEQ